MSTRKFCFCSLDVAFFSIEMMSPAIVIPSSFSSSLVRSEGSVILLLCIISAYVVHSADGMLAAWKKPSHAVFSVSSAMVKSAPTSQVSSS